MRNDASKNGHDALYEDSVGDDGGNEEWDEAWRCCGERERTTKAKGEQGTDYLPGKESRQ